MPLACLAKCPMTKFRRFFQAKSAVPAEELAEMEPIMAEEKQPTDEVKEMKRSAFGKMMSMMLVMFLGGCAGATGKTTTTDLATGKVVVTENPGFFESENLDKYYEFEGKRADKHAEVATAKISAIIETGAANMANYTTPIERAQGGLITQMMVAQVPVTPPPDGIAAPKTMVDMFDRNLIPLLSTGLQAYSAIWGDRGESASAADMTIANSGTGSVLVYSDGNSLQNYDLSANGDAGYISGLTFESSVTSTSTSTTNEGEKTYGLQLF